MIPWDEDSKAWDYARTTWMPSYAYEFARTFSVEYVPFTGWRRADFAGKLINVKGGKRHTKGDDDDPPKEALRVACFGGSALWGTGARDDHTIPSVLAGHFAFAGQPVVVENHAESAYTTWQAVIDLVLAVESAREFVPFDVAVLYGGVNDFWALLDSYDARRPLERPTHLFEQEFRRRFNRPPSDESPYVRRRPDEATPPTDETRFAETAVRLYRGAIDVARRVAEAHHVRVVPVWQPSLFSKTRHEDEERMFAKFKHGPALAGLYEDIADEATRTTSTLDLRTVLNGPATGDAPLFIDPTHTNELANPIIARVIHEALTTAAGATSATNAP